MLHRFLIAILSLTLLVSCCGIDANPRTISHGMVRDLNDATLVLMKEDDDGSYRTTCSAIWISSVRAATAAHCVDDAGQSELDALIGELTGRPWNPVGKPVPYRTWRDALAQDPKEPVTEARIATVVAFDEKNDLALIESKADPEDHGTVSLARSLPSQGDSVAVLGHPFGETYSYTPGFVMAIRWHEFGGSMVHVIQVFSGAAPGNSGGGVFDTEGRLLGICSHGYLASNIVYFVATDTVRNFLETH